MKIQGLKASRSSKEADWVRTAIRGDMGIVGGCVPAGYKAYARLFHPAADVNGNFASWSDVASGTARTAHALMQWNAISRPLSPKANDSAWQGESPGCGYLPPEILRHLYSILEAHTKEAHRSLFGFWMGQTWFAMSPRSEVLSQVSGKASQEAEPTRVWSTDELAGARFQVQGREYSLLEGPLPATAEFLLIEDGEREAKPLVRLTPNLLWPLDRAWFVAMDMDMDSSLIGGSPRLIGDIIDAPALEAWPIELGSSIAYDADRVNECVTK